MFVELEGEIEGLIHISEIGQEPHGRLEDKFKIGDPITAKIVKVDCDDRKIALSLREYNQGLETQELEEFHSAQGDPDQSLGRVAESQESPRQEESSNQGENA